MSNEFFVDPPSGTPDQSVFREKIGPIISPGLTPEQDERIDRLVNQGRNYTEARLMVGATVTGGEAELGLEPTEPEVSSTEGTTTHARQPAQTQKRNSRTNRTRTKNGKVDRRRLPPRGQLLADEPPEHIRHHSYD